MPSVRGAATRASNRARRAGRSLQDELTASNEHANDRAHQPPAAPGGGTLSNPLFSGDHVLESISKGTGSLRDGARGPSVRAVQEFLSGAGYGVGERGEDGVYGPMTRRGVARFQRDYGLPADGVVGAETLAAMDASDVTDAGPVESNDASSDAQSGGGGGASAAGIQAPSLDDVKGGAQLKLGMSGGAVEALQKLLGVSTTGAFDKTTHNAVMAFQRKMGLTPVSGVVGPTTLKAIEAAGSAPSADAAAQMARLVAVAEANNRGASLGDCFKFVWRYIVQAKYGKIRNHGDASDMPSDYAVDFANYMNSGDNAKRWGLKRLSLSSPYGAPRGSIVVVGPGTPGTRHPVAGDIAVAAGGGRFINDGPNMKYGPPERFHKDGGTLLGVYVPDV